MTDSKKEDSIDEIVGAAGSDKCEIHLIEIPYGQPCPKCVEGKNS